MRRRQHPLVRLDSEGGERFAGFLAEAVRQKLVRRLGDPDPDRAARLAREMDSMSMALPQVSVLRF